MTIRGIQIIQQGLECEICAQEGMRERLVADGFLEPGERRSLGCHDFVYGGQDMMSMHIEGGTVKYVPRAIRNCVVRQTYQPEKIANNDEGQTDK
jgi:hypothetical protein